MNDTQTRTEIEIFRRFADVCPLSIVQESIANRNPPEPDIVCRLAKPDESVAFELVEIIDEGWASLTSGQLREMSSLREAYKAATPDVRSALDERLGNALVYVSFSAAQARHRRSAIIDILRHLSTVAPGFVGEWNPSPGTSLHATVRSITITRGDFKGPEFDVEAVASIGDPTVERVRRKWSKSYITTSPIELLAYYELQPQAPTALWRPRLDSFITQNSQRGPFRRVWVFDVGGKTIPYESGLLATGRLTAQAPDGASDIARRW